MKQLQSVVMRAGLSLALMAFVGAAPAQPEPLPAETLARAAEAYGQLGTRLFTAQLAAQPQGSVLIAPVNLQSALAQLALGAEGDTVEAFTSAWNLAGPGEGPALYAALAAAERAASRSTQPGTQVQSTGAAWLAASLVPKATYRFQLRESYGITPQRLDFGRRDATGVINGWFARATQGLIPKVVEDLAPGTRLVLANAFYFKSQWQQPFEVSATRAAPFKAPAGARELPFLNATRAMPLAELPGVKAVWLPFLGGEYSMAVVLPDGDARSWAAASTAADWAALKDAASYRRRTVALSVPKLDVEAGQSMNQALSGAGLSALFAPNANFAGLGAPALPIDEVSHRVRLRMDETGAEAAAATAVIAVRSVGGAEEPLPFVADRPYLLMLVHAATGLTLLQALIESP